jgi:hypothetical protein
MAVAINTYTGLQSAVAEWLGRSGDTDITGRFDDLLALAEQRMWYGAAAVPGVLPAFEPVRIREMEVTDSAFALSATVAQPAGFLELISADLTSPYGPLRIENEATIAQYGQQAANQPLIIAVSGTNFRVWPDPGSSYTATLRYYKKLDTPTASAANWLLTYTPGVYLNACLMEACLLTGDFDGAQRYGALYIGLTAGLNERRNRELAAATNVRMRIRGRTP